MTMEVSASDHEGLERLDLVPSSSASHGVTYAQNVARDVADRIAAIHRRTRTRLWFGIGSLGAFAGAVAAAMSSSLQPDDVATALVYAVMVPAAAWSLYVISWRAEKRAEVLDRARDVSWVTKKDGLAFFSDEVFFVEHGVGLVPFTRGRYDVEGAGGGVLRLVDRNSLQVGQRPFRIEMSVPTGWTDADTQRIRERLR